jgi:glycine cleavage system H protein
MYPQEYRYSKEHEWVKVEDEACLLGITDFAQQELGEVVFVELPEIGQTFAAHDEIGTIESVKAVAEVYTPLSGEVIAVNQTLVDAPELVNDDPHGRGWLIRIRPSRPEELEGLMDAVQYEAYAAGEE